MDCSKGYAPPSSHKEPLSVKRFTLDHEPTDPVDRNREYPPIVTADGRVDTDIDHLMENAEDEALDAPVQDIPSQFPKPHVVRVIDGSLDDDIDNLVNHDGTMTHTLVDAPKNFKRGDLKEINSKSPSPSQTTKKENPTINRHHQASTYLDRIMSRDGAEEESTTKVVPYYERNNSSKAPTTNSDDADFCHLKESLDESYTSLSSELNKVNVAFVSNQCQKQTKKTNEYLSVYDHVKRSGEEVQILDEQKPDGPNSDSACENVEASLNAWNTNKGEAIESEELSRECSVESQTIELPQDVILQIIELFLKTMPKEELKRRLGIDTDSAKLVFNENEEQESKLTACDEIKDDVLVKSESEDKFKLKPEHKSVEVTLVLDNTTSEPIPQKEPNVQEAMSLLKQSLDIIAKDSSESSHITESQKMLAVTAMKVAGDSMNAAAKMADALTLLLKSTQTGNNPIAAQCSILCQMLSDLEKRVQSPAVTLSQPSVSKSFRANHPRKNKHHQDRESIATSPEKKNTGKLSGNSENLSEAYTNDPDVVVANPSPHKDKSVERRKPLKLRASKVKKEDDGKTSRRNKEHDDRSERKCSESRKLEIKHGESPPKRSLKKPEEYLNLVVVDDDGDIVNEGKWYSNRHGQDEVRFNAKEIPKQRKRR